MLAHLGRPLSCDGLGAGVKSWMTGSSLACHADSAIIAADEDRAMPRSRAEIGESFRKTDSHWIAWTLDSYYEKPNRTHARLTKIDDPTTYIIVSLDVLEDPRHFRRIDADL